MPIQSEGVGSSPRRFAAVVSTHEKLSVVGSSELLASVLPKHSPTSILPERWVGLPCYFWDPDWLHARIVGYRSEAVRIY